MWLSISDRQAVTLERLLKRSEAAEAAGILAELRKRQEEEASDEVRAYRRAAREKFNRDGELEFDDDSVVSLARADDGAYVSGWYWIYAEDAGLARPAISSNGHTGKKGKTGKNSNK